MVKVDRVQSFEPKESPKDGKNAEGCRRRDSV